MKTGLTHLPEQKQQELENIVHIIKEGVDVEMIILFGSYARGDWVEELDEKGVYYRYQSDFDILVIVDDRKLAKKWRVWKQIRDEVRRSGFIKTPASIISENLHGINHKLKSGHYFYSDIKKEGILLYDSGRHELAEEREMSLEERREKAKEDFDYWFESANGFYIQYQHAVKDKELNIAAFDLHQATERFYSAILLAFTGYKPKTHDLEDLSKQVASQDPSFLSVFPLGTAEEKRLFELLRNAYVDARYDKNYKITHEELQWLGERVSVLQKMTEDIYRKKIKSFAD